MKINGLLSSLIFTLLAFNSSVNAQTPDGATPANEGVCDPLRDDGITKGLYGLCVAFCEAQDIVSETDPVTESELDAILANVPSSRILTNYNRKKQSSDPGMPCIVEASACPCWTTEEIASIDGVHPAGYDLDLIYSEDGIQAVFFRETLEYVNGTTQLANAFNRPNGKFCVYQNYQVEPAILQRVEILTEEQANACIDLVKR